MIIKNTRNQKSLDCLEATSLFEKVRGLMFRRKIVPIVFDFFKDGIYAIHSFFVAAPFCAIYISSSGEIVDKFQVMPSEAHRQNSTPARYLLEVDEGRASWFEPGDKVIFHARMENVN